MLPRPQQILVISTVNRDDALLFVSCCHGPNRSLSYPLSTEMMPFSLSRVATAPADPCHIHCQQRRCPPLCLMLPRPQQILVIPTVNRDDVLLLVSCCHGPNRSLSYPQSTEMMPSSLSRVATAPADPCHIHCQQRRCPLLCLMWPRPRQILVISTVNRDDALLFVSCCHSPSRSLSYPLSTETMPSSLSHVATAPTDPCHIHCQQRRCPPLCLVLPRPQQILVISTVNRDDALLFVSCCHGPNRSLSYPLSTEKMPFSLSHVATAPTDPCHTHSHNGTCALLPPGKLFGALRKANYMLFMCMWKHSA